MIDPKAEVIFNDPLYKRIDPMRPGLKKVLITEDEIHDCRCLHLYRYNPSMDQYELKED